MMCLRGEEKLQSIHLDGEKGLIFFFSISSLKYTTKKKINRHFILTLVYFGIRANVLQASNETKHPHCSKNTAKIFE